MGQGDYVSYFSDTEPKLQKTGRRLQLFTLSKKCLKPLYEYVTWRDDVWLTQFIFFNLHVRPFFASHSLSFSFSEKRRQSYND